MKKLMPQNRFTREPTPHPAEVLQIDNGYVLFVGRASLLLERADAEAMVASLISTLARTPETQGESEVPTDPH